MKKAQNIQPTKVVIYARVSSKEQEKEGFSIPAQLKLLNSYAAEQGFQGVKEFVDVETAKSAGRTHFQEMVKFLRANSDIKAILVEKTDRLYRNFKDYVFLEELDLEIHLVKEGEIISRESRSHVKFIHGIKVLMAKNFIDNLSEEVRKGMREKAEQGDYPSRPPLGYRPNLQTNCIELDPERAELVEKLFEWYSTGQYSLKQLSQKAYEEGLGYRKSGRPISPSSLEAILRNPLYYGYFRWGGNLYKGNHISLLSRELFERVQEVLTNKHKAKERQHQFAFKGLLTCGHCGCAITAEEHIKKSGKRYVYYRCTGFKQNCAEPYMREEVISEKFGDLLKLIQINEEILNWIIEALKESNTEKKEYHQGMLSSLNRELSKIQTRLVKIYEDRLDGLITTELWEQMNKKYLLEQEAIKRKLQAHLSANERYYEGGIRILELAQRAYILYKTQNFLEQRKLLNFILLNCKLKDGELHPEFRQPFDMIVQYNIEAQKEKAENPEDPPPFEIWRPHGDLNPGRRRERPVSWTRLDDGDAFYGPCWIRTNDSLLKRQILYRLS